MLVDATLPDTVEYGQADRQNVARFRLWPLHGPVQ
jgi:hypothetical protein